MDEHLPGREIGQLGRWDSAIRAADPEVRRGLLMRETRKELRISAPEFCRPRPVTRKKIIQALHTNSLLQGRIRHLTIAPAPKYLIFRKPALRRLLKALLDVPLSDL